MAKRGRQPGFQMSEEHRLKIKVANILNALQDHVIGNRKMEATQVSAGLGLLRKVMPDLAAVDHSGEVKHDYVAEMPPRTDTVDEWQKVHGSGQTVQ